MGINRQVKNISLQFATPDTEFLSFYVVSGILHVDTLSHKLAIGTLYQGTLVPRPHCSYITLICLYACMLNLSQKMDTHYLGQNNNNNSNSNNNNNNNNNDGNGDGDDDVDNLGIFSFRIVKLITCIH